MRCQTHHSIINSDKAKYEADQYVPMSVDEAKIVYRSAGDNPLMMQKKERREILLSSTDNAYAESVMKRRTVRSLM